MNDKWKATYLYSKVVGKYTGRMVSKHNLRQMLIKQFSQLSEAQVNAASRQIALQVLQDLNWHSIHTVLSYVPLPRANELDPQYLIAALTDATIDIVAPRATAPFPLGYYDIVIVPLLGFDRDNYRLGRGGGWYDRFLAGKLYGKAIGLAYDFCLLDELPRDAHDIPLCKIYSVKVPV